jgi:epothilone polyketide synthase D
VGVFVGLCNNEWKATSDASDAVLGPYDTTGSAQSAAANRISFLLGLEGPSLVVDTACSSSLAALHTAMNALRCGDCDVALVAAADLLVSSHSLKVQNILLRCKYVGVSWLTFVSADS